MSVPCAFCRRHSAREEKAAGPKMRALQDTVLRMNEKNVRLQQENKALKEDLDKLMDESAQSKARNGEKQARSFHDVSCVKKRKVVLHLSKTDTKVFFPTCSGV